MLCTHCGEPLEREDLQCPLCGKEVSPKATLPKSGGMEADKEPAFIRRFRFERSDEEGEGSKPDTADGDGAAAQPPSSVSETPKARRRRSRTTPLTARTNRHDTPKDAANPDVPPAPTPAPIPDPPPADKGGAEKATAPKSVALGESPLEDAPQEERQQTSEELKRVLQTVFATSRHREPSEPKPARPHGPPPVPPLAPPKETRPYIQPPPVPPPAPAKAPGASAKPPPPADDWSLGEGTPPVAETAKSGPLPEVDSSPVLPVVAETAKNTGEERRLGPDLADFWSLGGAKAGEDTKQTNDPRSDPDEDDFVVETPDAGTPDSVPSGLAFHDADDEDEVDATSDRDEEDDEEELTVRYREEVEEIRITVAGFARRAVAGLADRVTALLITLVVLTAALYVVPVQYYPPTEGGTGLLVAMTLQYPALLGVSLALWLLVDVLLMLGCTLATGQTPGKMLFDLRVIQTDGEPLTAPYALLRVAGLYLGVLALFIGPLWAAMDSHKQGLHDKLAGTYVIRVNAAPD